MELTMAVARLNQDKNPGENGAKARVVRSALKLFSEKGYTAASIREIIEDAGVTRPVLYYYFKNKEDLFCQIVEEAFQGAYAETEEILNRGLSCRETLKLTVRQSFQSAKDSPELVRTLIQFFFSPADPELRVDREELGRQRFEQMMRIMDMGIHSGEIEGPDVQKLALAFLGIMDMRIMANSTQPDIDIGTELGDALVDLFIDGAHVSGLVTE